MNDRATRRRISCRTGLALAAGLGLLASLGACRDPVSGMRELQREGRYTETLEPLRERLARQPADPELNLLYGRALLMTGQAGGAVWPLSRAGDDPEHAVEAGLLLGSALLQGGSATDAIVAANRVLDLDPENREALRLRARARVDAVHNEEAIQEIDALIEKDLDDPQLHALRIIPLIRMRRLDEARESLGDLRELLRDAEFRDPMAEAHFCAAEATFLHEREEKEKAEKAWEECVERHEGNAAVLRGALEFYRGTGQVDAVRALLERSLEQEPRNTEVRIAFAELLRSGGEAEEGVRLMEEGAREFPSPERWSALADYHVAGGDFQGARQAVERAIEMMPSVPDELRFAYADVLILAGDPDAAEQIVETLELPVQQDLLRGRIQLVRGDARSAFESFEKGIRYWPNNAMARYLAGQAAERLGRFDEAVSQYREAVRVDPSTGEAALALVELQTALGSPNLAIEPLRIHLNERPQHVAAWRAWVRLLFRTGDTAGTRRALTHLRGLDRRAAAIEAAAMRRESGDPQAAVRALEASRIDPTALPNHEVLSALVDAHIEAGSPASALARVDAALAANPDAPALYELRGRALAARGDAAGASTAFERALAFEADRAAALTGLARLAEQRDDLDVALALYDRAHAADPSAAEPVRAAADVAAARGDLAQAVERFEDALRIAPLDGEAALRLAELLADESRELGRALDHARRAVAVGGGPRALETLGRVQVLSHHGPAALETLREVLEQEPERASAHYWLGRALALTGDEASAREAYRKALAGGPREAEQARAALATLDEEGR